MTVDEATPRQTHRRAGWWIVAVAVSWLLNGALQAPVPAVNEPHYLTKARHFWQPDWCAGDFFLESPDAHVVFFATVGALTTVFPLETAAWVGRLLATGVLATGWVRLGAALRLSGSVSLLAAWLFLLIQSVLTWSGEWVIGGVEGKVFACGGLLWATACWIDGQTLRAAALLGMAIAFHPVVGLWGLLAALGSGTLLFSRTDIVRFLTTPRTWGAMLFTGLVACPGLLPVLSLLTTPVPDKVRYAGTYLQVYFRLAHHLDPMRFPVSGYVGMVVLIAVWAVALITGRKSTDLTGDDSTDPAIHRSRRWLHGIVACSLLFALAGVLLGAGPRPPQLMPGFEWRMQLLKFYPFRLADVLLPGVVAWMLAAAWVNRFPSCWQTIGTVVLLAALVLIRTVAPIDPAIARRDADWRNTCEWIRTQTPANVLVQTPRDRSTFKWYAQRPEYVTYKDCPQDVAGIVEWNRRLQFLAKWYQDHYADGHYSEDDLRDLVRQTGLTHLITDRLGPFDLPPSYQNDTYRVYDLTQLAPSS